MQAVASLPLRSGGRCRRRMGAISAEAFDPSSNSDTSIPRSAPFRLPPPSPASGGRVPDCRPHLPFACAGGGPHCRPLLPFPCAAGEGAEGGWGRLVHVRLFHSLPPSGCRHLPPRAGEGFQIAGLTFPSPAQGGVPHCRPLLPFPCAAGEGAEGGWGRLAPKLLTHHRIRIRQFHDPPPSGCRHLPPPGGGRVPISPYQRHPPHPVQLIPSPRRFLELQVLRVLVHSRLDLFQFRRQLVR